MKAPTGSPKPRGRQADADALHRFAGVDESAQLRLQLQAAVLAKEEAERQLDKTTRELTHFVETAAIGMHWVGPDGKILWANAAEMQMLGYSRHEYIGRHIAEFHADAAVIDSILACLQRGERIRECEARLRCKDGSIKIVQIDSSVFWENGKFVHTQCFTRDITAQREAEGALRRSEERYRRVLALLPAAVYTCAAPSGEITYCNEHAVRLWGRAPALGTTEDRFCGSYKLWQLDGNPLPHEETPMALALRDGRPFRNLDVIIERPDGTRITVLVNIDPIRDDAGLVVGAVNVFHDTTALKEAEATLRENERLFRAMINALPAAIYTTDAEGRLTHFNPSAVEFSGRVPEIGTDQWCVSWKLYHPDGTPMPLDECPMARALKRGEVVRGAEAICERPNGKRIWFTPYPTPLRNEAGEIVGGINMLVDITERKNTERALAHLAAIVESSDDAIISKDLTGTIRSWNLAAERLFGYTAQEAIGRPITMLMPPEQKKEEPRILQQIVGGKHIDHYESVRRRKDGTLIQVSLTVSPIKDASGKTIGASKIVRDITERKRAEQALAAAQAQLQQHAALLEETVTERTVALRATIAELESFSYSISHDMRGPLRAMQGFATILQEEARQDLSAEHVHYLDRIYNAANRLDRLIQDILKYSRMSRAEITLSPVDLDALLRDIVQNYPAFQASTIHLESPLPTVIGHDGYLTQCFSNLLGNAVKFVAEGVQPKVRVWSELSHGRARIWVEDNGIGIAPHDQARIFNIYERVHDGKRYEGTGIGLSIVRKAAERLGGAVGVLSEPGRGSRFWVELRLP